MKSTFAALNAILLASAVAGSAYAADTDRTSTSNTKQTPAAVKTEPTPDKTAARPHMKHSPRHGEKAPAEKAPAGEAGHKG